MTTTALAPETGVVTQFNPYHGPDGKFAPGPGGGLSSRLVAEGGFTYQPITKESPVDGYMVSPYKGRETVIDGTQISSRQLSQYVRRNSDLLQDPSNYMGGWVDGGKTYLDVSKRCTSFAEAMDTAINAQQIAFYDLKTGTTVYAPTNPGQTN